MLRCRMRPCEWRKQQRPHREGKRACTHFVARLDSTYARKPQVCARTPFNQENHMSKSPRQPTGDGPSRLNRRTLFAGAGTVGAVAAVATVLPRVQPEAPAAAAARPAPTRGGGYNLSEHVKHYYQTTRI